MAAEWAVSAAADTARNLATESLSTYINYFFRFGKIVDEFKIQQRKLELEIKTLQHVVDEAERQNVVIYDYVKEWLATANKELKEAQSLEGEIERITCFSWCPNWGWRYYLSMKAAKRTLRIKSHIEICGFPQVGELPPLQGLEFLPSKDFKAFQSSKVAFNAIIKALKTVGVNMIGLYGMPGVGKTTLAEEVGRYAGEENLFEKRVMVTMSQTPTINNIQNKIAKILGLKFEDQSEEIKAEMLLRRLNREKILIIIEDVWKDFKFKTIGIPYDGKNKDCKILITTRRQEVCDKMNCDEKFELKILREDEAWVLFKFYAGLEDLSPTTTEFTELIEVAMELARECQGLPLAIRGFFLYL